MAWINPETFEVLEISCGHEVKSAREWSEITDWCDANLGKKGVDWMYSIGLYEPYPRIWCFRTHELAVAFKMRWL